MRVILVSGKAQSGKDTTANMLKDALEVKGLRVLITHYADLLKYICKNFLGWNGEKDEYGRHLLQHVGTDVVRAQNPNFWVDFVAQVLVFLKGTWDYVIIPDCRFPNEISRLEDHGFHPTHIRIVRDGIDSGLTNEQKAHSSETALDCIKPDFYIVNDGSMSDLCQAVKKLIDNDIEDKI